MSDYFIPFRKMTAAILVEQKMPLQISEVDMPLSLDVGQVLVKISFSGICGSQLGEIDGVKGQDKYLPHLLGHEASGEVVLVGPGVRHVNLRDKVVLHWRKGPGIDAIPPKYSWEGKVLNAGPIATFAQYAIVSENRCTRIQLDSDLRSAALLGCAITTGYGVVQNEAQLKIGQSVVVFGAGGVGLSVIQAAKITGGYPIIAVDKYENRLNLAKDLGATHIVLVKDGVDTKRAIMNIAGGEVDVFIDNTGISSVIEMGYLLIKPQGVLTLVGVPNSTDLIRINTLPMHFGKIIKGSDGGKSSPAIDIPRYNNLSRLKIIDFNKLITNEFPLESINQAIDLMRNGQANGRCLVNLGNA